MRILIESDSTSPVDIQKSVAVLEVLCKSINFKILSARQISRITPTFVDFQQEMNRIEKRFDRDKNDYYIYVTSYGLRAFRISFTRSKALNDGTSM